jgi:hypothetical protein
MQLTDPFLDPDEGEMPAILGKLTKDVRVAAHTLTPKQARFLVDLYYSWQNERIRQANQVRALSESGEPHDAIAWVFGQSKILERQVQLMLDTYTRTEPTGMGLWARSITGIGPVIAAGLVANIDITRSPTVGHIWSFAGLNPMAEWKKGEKRPWNASLKVLCWKLGESFVKVSSNKSDIYGKIYLKRKEYEQIRNLRGDYAPQARAKLEKYRIGLETDARTWYEGCLTAEHARKILEAESEKRQSLAKSLAGPPASGIEMLPPAHIHARSKRYAVKLFLAHYHEVAYERHYQRPAPLPYPIAHLNHVDYFPPPNWKEVLGEDAPSE